MRPSEDQWRISLPGDIGSDWREWGETVIGLEDPVGRGWYWERQGMRRWNHCLRTSLYLRWFACVSWLRSTALRTNTDERRCCQWIRRILFPPHYPRGVSPFSSLSLQFSFFLFDSTIWFTLHTGSLWFRRRTFRFTLHIPVTFAFCLVQIHSILVGSDGGPGTLCRAASSCNNTGHTHTHTRMQLLLNVSFLSSLCCSYLFCVSHSELRRFLHVIN